MWYVADVRGVIKRKEQTDVDESICYGKSLLHEIGISLFIAFNNHSRISYVYPNLSSLLFAENFSHMAKLFRGDVGLQNSFTADQKLIIFTNSFVTSQQRRLVL